MTYRRVLPRDAFNEANFLKCIGKLTMDLEEGFFSFIQYHYDGEPFNLEQNIDGCLYITNINFWFMKQQLQVIRPLNSKEPWPLYVETENGTLPIFDDNGSIILTAEDLTLLLQEAA